MKAMRSWGAGGEERVQFGGVVLVVVVNGLLVVLRHPVFRQDAGTPNIGQERQERTHTVVDDAGCSALVFERPPEGFNIGPVDFLQEDLGGDPLKTTKLPTSTANRVGILLEFAPLEERINRFT